MGLISSIFSALFAKRISFILSLACAALSHPVYSLFLVGHIIGLSILKWTFRKSKTTINKSVRIQQPWYQVIKVARLFLLVLTCLTFIFPANHPIYNHLGGSEKDYVPVPLNGFTTAFFQIGLHKEVMRTIPEAELMYQDWYFTKNKIYGDANSVFEAVINNPRVFTTNLIENSPGFITLTRRLIGGYQWYPPLSMIWNVFSYILMLTGLIYLIRIAQKNRKLEYIAAALFGTSTFIAILFLTSFSTRYSVILLPFTIMLVSNMPSGMVMVWNNFKNAYKKSTQRMVVGNQSDRRLQRIGFLVLTVFGLLAILIIPILLKSLPPEKKITLIISLIIFVLLEILCIYFLLQKPGHVRLFLSGWFDPMVYKCPQLVKTGFILAVVLVLFWNNPRPFDTQRLVSHSSIENWIRGRFLLQGEVSMSRAYPKLMEGIDREHTRILTLSDSMWALGIANLRLDGVHTIYILPPFKDDSGDVEKFLNNLDEIWINKYDAIPSYDVSTQNYLRYKLHVMPFLEKNVGNGWIRKDIKNFGIRFIKTKVDQHT